MNIGTTGVIQFKDGPSRVKIVDITRNRMFPDDYWFWYQDDETYRPIEHPDPQFKEKFPLPGGLVDQVFTPDKKQPA